MYCLPLSQKKSSPKNQPPNPIARKYSAGSTLETGFTMTAIVMRIAKPHSITDFDGSYVGTNLGDNAYSLVPKDNAELHRMFIRKATSRVRDFDNCVLPPNLPLRRTLRNRPVLLPAINSEFNRHPSLSAIGVRTSRGGVKGRGGGGAA